MFFGVRAVRQRLVQQTFESLGPPLNALVKTEYPKPKDRVLSAGLVKEEGRRQKSLLLACGALAREILEIIRINRLDHLELQCLPADLHLHPEKIPAAVESAVRQYRDDYRSIFVVYADCGTGGLLEAKCEELGVEMVRGPHCYAFYDGLKNFNVNSESETTAFYLTDFLVRQFDAFVWKPLGLYRHPELRDMYFAGYDRLIYLAQLDDKDLDKLAEECARRLELQYERRLTGYGDLSEAITRFAANRIG